MGMNPNDPNAPGYPPSGPQYPPQQGGGYQGYPPPPPPGYQGYQNQQPVYAPVNTSFNIQDLFQRWQAVLMGRSVPTFDAQLPSANWNTILISVGLLGAAEAIFGIITSAEAGFGFSIGSFIGSLIGAYIGFFIGAGILYVLAKLFGGVGAFLPYAWLISLVAVPIGIIDAVAGIIPVLGSLVALVLGLYAIYLLVLATMSAHRLTMGKSFAVVLIPAAVALVLAFIFAVIIGAALFAAGGLR